MTTDEAGAVAQISATLLVAVAVSLVAIPIRDRRDRVFSIGMILGLGCTLLAAAWAMSVEPEGWLPRTAIYLMLAGSIGLSAIVFIVHVAEGELTRRRVEEGAATPPPKPSEELDRRIVIELRLPSRRRPRGTSIHSEENGTSRG